MSQQAEAPQFRQEPYPGSPYYARCYDESRRRSLVVKSAFGGGVDFACHAHDSLYSSTSLSVAEARAVAAALIAAADAAEQQEQAA